MLDRKTTKNLVMYFTYQALRYCAPIILTPFLARTLTKGGFSDLVILNSCIWTSTVFMEFGFYLYGVSKTSIAADREELSRTVTAITVSKSMLVPVALIAYVALAAWSGLLFRNPQIVMVGALSAIGYGGSFAWFFQGQQRGGVAVLTEAIPQIVYYVLILSFVRSPRDLFFAALVQAIPPVASLGVSLTLISRAKHFGRPNWVATKRVFGEAFPYFVERFCFTLYTAIAPTLVAALSTPAEASYYSIGDRVGIFLGTIPLPLFQAAVPLVAKAFHKDKESWRLPLSLVASVTAVVAAISSLTFLSIGWVISRFFSHEFQPSIVVAKLFCINSIVSVLGMSLANFVIIPRNAARIMTVSSSIAMLVGIAAQCLLVPHYGAVGAVLSRITSESIVALILGSIVIRMLLESQSGTTLKKLPVEVSS